MRLASLSGLGTGAKAPAGHWLQMTFEDGLEVQLRGQARLFRHAPEISWAYDVAGRCPRLAIAVIPRELWGLLRWRSAVADHGEVAYTTADGNDYVAHEATYLGFLKLVKYGTITVIIIVALMGIFLT